MVEPHVPRVKHAAPGTAASSQLTARSPFGRDEDEGSGRAVADWLAVTDGLTVALGAEAVDRPVVGVVLENMRSRVRELGPIRPSAFARGEANRATWP